MAASTTEQSTTFIPQGFFSPLSLSRSMSSRKYRQQSPPPAHPAPSGNQEELESHLFSMSSATPRSILSNKSSTTEEMKHDLQSLLVQIDNMTFTSPYIDKSVLSQMEQARENLVSTSKDSNPPSSLKSKGVLAERTNITKKPYPEMTPLQMKRPNTRRRDPTPNLKPKRRPSLHGRSLSKAKIDPEGGFQPSGPASYNADQSILKASESVVLETTFSESDLARHHSVLTTHFDEESFDQRSDDSSYGRRGELSFGMFPLSDVAEETATAVPSPIEREEEESSVIQHPPVPRTPEDARVLLETAVQTLQDARAEREAARSWANDMKDAVENWAEEQRKLIRTETTTRLDALEEQEEQVRNQTKSLQSVEQGVKRLYETFQSNQVKGSGSYQQLEQMLLDQQEKIHGLSQQLSSIEHTVSEGMSIQRLTPRSSSQPGKHHGGSGIPQFVDKSPENLTSTASCSQSNQSSSSRIRKPLPGGGHCVVYTNGVHKEVHKDGTTVVRFVNGDVETKFRDSGTVAYFHASECVLQITTADGSMLFEYPNGQIERHYTDGSKGIIFPDGSKARVSPSGKKKPFGGKAS